MTTATVSWIAPVDGDFSDAADWSTGTVPGYFDAAQIEADGDYTVTMEGGDPRALRLGSGVSLQVDGTSEIGVGGLTVGPSASVSVNSGNLWLQARGPGAHDAATTKETFNGTVTVGPSGVLGAYAVGSGGSINFLGTGRVELEGSIFLVEVPGAFYSGVDISGSGEISANASYMVNGGVINSNVAGQTLTVNGTLSVWLENFGTMEATNGAEMDIDVPAVGGTVATFASTGPGSKLVFNDQTSASGLQASGTVEASDGGAVTFNDSVGHVTLTDDGDGLVLGTGVQLNGTFTLSDGGQMQVSASTLVGTLTAAAGSLFEFTSGANLVGYVTAPLSLTGAARLDDGASLILRGGLVNAGTLSVQGGADATGITLFSESDYGATSTLASREIDLSGTGTISLSDSSENLIAPYSAEDILVNDGNTITGAGQIGGGAAMSIQNAGVIDASGVNALVVNIGTGKLTNQVNGLLEGTGSGGLSFTGGTLDNSGTIQALDGSSVTFGSGAVISNSHGGTLTGGHWYATDTGDGAGISLSGAAITTLDGLVKLSGAASAFSAGGEALESSLATIASGGRLELLAGRSWDGAMALTDDGLVQLGGGTFQSAGLTVGASGTLLGVGEVSGSVTDNGLIESQGGALAVAGDVSGSGTLKVLGHTTLEAGGAVSSSLTALFNPGAEAVLKLDDPAAFAAVISGWAHSDVIDLSDTDATSAVIDGTTLEVGLSGGGSLDFSLSSALTGVHVVLSSDGGGGTNLTLRTGDAPAVAQITQAMAGMTPASGAGAVHTAHAAPAPLATLAAPGA